MKRCSLGLLLALSGCTSDGIEPLQPLEIATAPYAGLVTTSMSGTLMYEGGCLLFRSDDNRMQYFPVWPDGTVFNGTSVIFHEPGRAEQRIVVSEEVLLEGHPLDWATIPGPRMALHRQRCGRTPFAVLRVRPAN